MQSIEMTDKCRHTPKPVYEEGDVTVLCHQAVNTDGEVTANRPGIMIENHNENTCMLIDVAIPADRKALEKEAKKKQITRVFV
jgi:3-oxoacyl-[acyl-carrier-protein] synthase III